MSIPAAITVLVTFANPLTPLAFWSGVQKAVSSRIWHGAYQSLIEMVKLQGEMNGAKQVHEHAENKDGSLDSGPAVWAVRVKIDGYNEEKRITP